MRTSDFDYDLPSELIAQTPIEPRDASRLLVLERGTGRIEHSLFAKLPGYLLPGDVLVLNDSRVLPARLRGRRSDTGGQVELLLVRQEGQGIWQALGKPGRGLLPGVTLILEGNGAGPVAEAEVLATLADGIKRVRLARGDVIFEFGEMPLPPYIHQRLEDPERYQTVYAQHPGSVAAPTAGLHFTRPMLKRLQDGGVEMVYVTLHVGLDTFGPVRSDDPVGHKIHTEEYEFSAEAAAALNRARAEGRRIVAVGTTSVRVLEQAAQDAARAGHKELEPRKGRADLFILPGHRFRLVNCLITNFHLPRTTLLMLVAAFAGRNPGKSPGLDLVLQAYREAIARRYRFYSFGDAMLIT